MTTMSNDDQHRREIHDAFRAYQDIESAKSKAKRDAEQAPAGPSHVEILHEIIGEELDHAWGGKKREEIARIAAQMKSDGVPVTFAATRAEMARIDEDRLAYRKIVNALTPSARLALGNEKNPYEPWSVARLRKWAKANGFL